MSQKRKVEPAFLPKVVVHVESFHIRAGTTNWNVFLGDIFNMLSNIKPHIYEVEGNGI